MVLGSGFIVRHSGLWVRSWSCWLGGFGELGSRCGQVFGAASLHWASYVALGSLVSTWVGLVRGSGSCSVILCLLVLF